MDEKAAAQAIVVHLVGPPGCGKSALAKALGWAVVDAADYPAKQIGRTDWPKIDRQLRRHYAGGEDAILVSTGLSRGAWQTIEASPAPVHTIMLVPSSTETCRGRLYGRSRRRAGPSLEKILSRWESMLEDPGGIVWPGLKFAIRHPVTFDDGVDLGGLQALLTRLREGVRMQ